MDVIIGCETFMLVLLVLVMCIFLYNKQLRRERDRYFMDLLVCSTIALFCDLHFYKLIGKPGISEYLLSWVTWSAYFFTAMQMIFFMYYVYSYVKEKRPLNKWFVHVPTMLMMIVLAMDIVGVITGSFFRIVDTQMKIGVWYYPSMICKVIGIFYLLVYVCVLAMFMDTTERFAMITFAAIPALSLMVELVNDNVSFVCTGGALGTFMAFMFLQSKTAGDSHIREKVLFELSHIDPLTGLNNRLACEDSMNKMKEYDPRENLIDSIGEEAGEIPFGRAGVIYTDLNNLKSTNDNFGHDAGDELICNYTDMLKSVFGDITDDEANIRKIFGKERKRVGIDLLDCVYRISGDEFVSIIPDTRLSEQSSAEAQEKFVMLVESLREAVAENNDIAAVGCSFGPQNEVERLISEAEKKMYADKAAIYKKLGIERRKY